MHCSIADDKQLPQMDASSYRKHSQVTVNKMLLTY